ncbi:hypothetical protein ACFP1Z_28720 [Streptomyces gamaensis]|uniref:Uncharacterized protein n=1 Tax=Streptomyces gamaensis TaxID=1763542 RepID=A0ABW0Z7P4_9ACTN
MPFRNEGVRPLKAEPTVMHIVDAGLDSPDLTIVLASAWEAFALGERAADASAWAPGHDEVQALTAAQACAAGRSLLPLPATASVVAEYVPDSEHALLPCADLLLHTRNVLDQLAAATVSEGCGHLREAAEHAGRAARALQRVRG